LDETTFYMTWKIMKLTHFRFDSKVRLRLRFFELNLSPIVFLDAWANSVGWPPYKFLALFFFEGNKHTILERFSFWLVDFRILGSPHTNFWLFSTFKVRNIIFLKKNSFWMVDLVFRQFFYDFGLILQTPSDRSHMNFWFFFHFLGAKYTVLVDFRSPHAKL
jgi:hypothetical protein